MNRHLCLIFICLLGKFGFSQELIYFNAEARIKTKDYFESQQSALHLSVNDEMKPSYENTDAKQVKHLKFQQIRNGLPIIGAYYFLHTKDDEVIKSHGIVYPDQNVATEASVSVNEAIDIAEQHIFNEFLQKKEANLCKDFDQVEWSKCYIDVDYPKITNHLALAYEIILECNSRAIPIKRKLYIDAMTSRVIFSTNLIKNHGVPGRGQSNYYGEVSFIHDSLAPNKFQLADSTRGYGIIVKDVDTRYVVQGDKANWPYLLPLDRSAIDVFYATQKYYDFLKSRFNRNSLDGHGFRLNANVKQFLFNNAYWDGLETSFGGGDCYSYNPFTYIDIVGHEFTHGLIQFTADLDYYGESGALNESISDIFGKALEYEVHPQTFSWDLGGKVSKDSTSFFRSMRNPNDQMHPKYYKGKYWEDSGFFGIDLHVNNGVCNFWFYLLSEGKNAVNEKNVRYDVKKIGIDKALNIVYHALVNYMLPNTDYVKLREYTLESAKDLYSENSFEYNQVLEAWKAVGVLDNVNINLSKYPSFQPSNYYNIRVCEDELQNYKFTFRNTSLITYAAGDSLGIKIVMHYFAFDSINYSFKDTIYNAEVVLKNSLLPDSSLSIHVPLKFQKEIKYVLFDVTFEYFIIVPYLGNRLEYKYNGSIRVVPNTFTKDKLFSSHLAYSPVLNKCNNSYIRYLNYYIYPHICDFGEYKFVLEMQGENDNFKQEENIHFDPAIGNGVLTFFKDVYYFGHLGDPDKVVLNLYYELDNIKYLIHTDSLYKYYSKNFPAEKLLTFSNSTDTRYFITNTGIFSDTAVISGRFKISNDYTQTVVDNCVEVDEFYNITDKIGNDEFKSSIEFCSDISTLKNPYVSFDLQLWNIMNIAKDRPYTHYLTLEQDGVKLSSKRITSTNNANQKFEFPLTKSGTTTLIFESYNYGSSTLLDNIIIYDKQTVGTEKEQLKYGMSVRYLNDHKVIIEYHPNNAEPWDLYLFDTNGKLVLKQLVKNTYCEIDMKDFPVGVFLVSVIQKDQKYNSKIINLKS